MNTTKEIIDRFLCWKLPADFHPDGGVSFAPGHATPSSPWWPIGTNLLTSTQAKAMLDHVLGGDYCTEADEPETHEQMLEINDTKLLDWVIGYRPKICMSPNGEWVWVEWCQYGETRRTYHHTHGRVALREAMRISLMPPNTCV